MFLLNHCLMLRGEPEWYAQYDWNGWTIKVQRAQIREFFGFREATIEDAEKVMAWLCEHVLHSDLTQEHIREAAYRVFRELKIEPPKSERLATPLGPSALAP